MTKSVPVATGRSFYGWKILALASVTGALTGPGQTLGVSIFVDHFIADLGLSRSQVSTSYLIGTLAASIALPWIGHRIDMVGVRRAMTIVGAIFGTALVAMAGVQGFVSLTLGFVAIRLFGQGSLMLLSTISVTLWFDRIRGTALGIFNTANRLLMSLVPVGLSFVMSAYDWRFAWVTAGLVVWMVVIPIARFGLIDRPADIGQMPDGDAPRTEGAPTVTAPRSLQRAEALRTKKFWVLAATSAAIGMMSTALNFHQISLLGDAGLSPTEAAIMFLPQVVGAAIGGIAFGWMADKLAGRTLIPLAMGLLTTSLLLASNLSPGWSIVLYALCLGMAAGSSRSIISTLLPRWFGVLHIGAIQGTATLITVASTALGPVAFSMVRDVTGNYDSAARWFSLIPVAAGIAGLTLKPAMPGRDNTGPPDTGLDAR